MDWKDKEPLNRKQNKIARKLDFFRPVKTESTAPSFEEEQHWNGKLNFDFFSKTTEKLKKPSFLRNFSLSLVAVTTNMAVMIAYLHIMHRYYPTADVHNGALLFVIFWFSWFNATHSIAMIKKFFLYQHTDKKLLKKPLLSLLFSFASICTPALFFTGNIDNISMNNPVSVVQGSNSQINQDINRYQSMHPSSHIDLQNVHAVATDAGNTGLDYPQTR